jgi:hypothetical protein
VSGGNLSAVSAPFTVTTKVNDGSDVTPPTQPSNVQAFGYGDLEMQVWWTASTDAVTPQSVIVYEIYVNGVHENTAIGTNMTPSAYGVHGNNVVTVIAIDEAGQQVDRGHDDDRPPLITRSCFRGSNPWCHPYLVRVDYDEHAIHAPSVGSGHSHYRA